MAIKNIGRTLSGGAIALCVILFCCLSINGQGFTPQKKTFTISGSVGQSNVPISGLPGNVISDENGYYSANVEYGWSGRVKPIKKGYTFNPPEMTYNNVKSNFENQNYTFDIMKFTMSGSVGQPGVIMTGLPGNPISGSGGIYKGTVEYGWSGTVIPELTGYIFTPMSKPYTQVDRNYTNEHYKAEPITFTISGSVDEGGVLIKGLPKPVVSEMNGNYIAIVPYNWTGTVKPDKVGFTFSPAERSYTNIMNAQTSQDYIASPITFTISGTVGQADVIMNGLPNNPISNSDGTYSAVVNYGFNGVVRPEKRGYTFNPPSISYTKVTTDLDNQDYFPKEITYTISGSVGKEGVVMTGLTGNPISGPDGTYKAVVPFEWSGTVTPELIGYTFSPSRKVYPRVTADQTQNYTVAQITFTISGTTGVAGVEMKGLSRRVVTDQNGNYSTLVPYGWSGTVVPYKNGYTFNPPERTYPPLISAAVNEDYTWLLQKRAISGKIISAEGPVEGVRMFADNGGGSAITDFNGAYQLSVNFGWSGVVTPEKQGLTFKPVKNTYPRVLTDQANRDHTAAVVKFNLSGTMSAPGGTPLESIVMSASEGGKSDITDAKGRYSVEVPFGWSGEIAPKHDAYNFDPPSRTYTNVTADYVDGVPIEREPEPTPPQAVISTPTQQPPTQAPPVQSPARSGMVTQGPTLDLTTGLGGEFEEQRALIEQQVGTMQQQVDELLRQLSGEAPGPNVTAQVGPNVPAGLFPGVTAPNLVPARAPTVRGGPLVSIVCIEMDLREILQNLSAQAGVKIYADDTVKGTLTCRLVNVPLEKALEEVLKDTEYLFKEVPNSYLVYKPISNTFFDTDIRDVLKSIATTAGVVIIPDEIIAGTVTAVLDKVPLDTALDIILAGTSYVVKKTPYYYLVASAGVADPAFPAVSETRRVKMNYIGSDIALGLLSPVFRPYIQAETGTHTVLITAPANLVSRIVSDLKEIDQPPRHVMLDARIVVMESSNLLNLGVEWGWPKIRMGVFGSDFQGGGDADLQFGGNWPWGVQIGYTPDAVFTDSLLLTLNLLAQNGEADIVSNPQVLAQDGRQAELNVMNEEYYYLSAPERVGGFYTEAQLETIEAGTNLQITPRIGDNNDITLEIAAEVSDVVSRGEQNQGTMPLVTVTRRRATNTVRIRDGGTVALAGLTENRTVQTNKRVPGLSRLPLVGKLFKNKSNQQASREIAVFITARLVPEMEEYVRFSEPDTEQILAEPVGEQEFRMKLRQSLMSQNR